MKLDNVVMGIDIGATKVAAALCEIQEDGSVGVLGTGTSICSGIKKGQIIRSHELNNTIERAMLRAETTAGIKTPRLICNFPLFKSACSRNSGLVHIQREDERVTAEDKTEAMRRSMNILKKSAQTIMHVWPMSYWIDGKPVEDPVGRKGTYLEVKSQLILGHTTSVSQLTNLIKGMDLKINGIVFDGLATAEIALSDEEKRMGCILIDMGAEFTRLLFFKDKKCYRSMIIPVGGNTLSSDIAYCLNVALSEAERLKVLYGKLNWTPFESDATITIKTKTGEKEKIKYQLLGQIIQARITEVLGLCKKKMETEIHQSKNIILMGGGAQLKGLATYIKVLWKKEVRFGLPEDVTVTQLIKPEYATAMGLVMVALSTKAIQYIPQDEPGSKMGQWFKKVFN